MNIQPIMPRIAPRINRSAQSSNNFNTVSNPTQQSVKNVSFGNTSVERLFTSYAKDNEREIYRAAIKSPLFADLAQYSDTLKIESIFGGMKVFHIDNILLYAFVDDWKPKNFVDIAIDCSDTTETNLRKVAEAAKTVLDRAGILTPS